MFSYEELRLIKRVLIMEIIRREDNPKINVEKLAQFEKLCDKVDDLIKDMKTNT